MSCAQADINALRNGEFDKLAKLEEKYKKELINKQSVDELFKLMVSKFSKADITANDITKIYLTERFIEAGIIVNSPTPTNKDFLALMLKAFISAISLKWSLGYKNLKYEKKDVDINIEEILSEDSTFSKQLNEEDVKEQQTRLEARYNRDVAYNGHEIKELLAEIESKPDFHQFIKAFDQARHNSIKLKQLKTIKKLEKICEDYIDHLIDDISNYVIKYYDELFPDGDSENISEFEMTHDRIDNPDKISTFAESNKNYKTFKKLRGSSHGFILAIQKYRAVVDMKDCLDLKGKSGKQPSQIITDFKEKLSENKTLLNQRRDSAGTIFLKGVATLLTLGLVLTYDNFWKSKSQKMTDKIENMKLSR